MATTTKIVLPKLGAHLGPKTRLTKHHEVDTAPFPACANLAELLAVQAEIHRQGMKILSPEQTEMILRAPNADEQGIAVGEDAAGTRWFFSERGLPKGDMGTKIWFCAGDHEFAGSYEAAKAADKKHFEKLKAVSATTVSDLLGALDRVAPASLSLGDDPRGLMVGARSAPLRKVVVALDATVAVIDCAVKLGAGAVVAHHPLIYGPLKSVSPDDPHPGAAVVRAIENGVAVVAAHTCWDVADGGINDILARLLGLTDIHPLKATAREPLLKLVIYVPVDYRERVFDAVARAGAGAIGTYDRCGFWSEGTGTFRPAKGAKPFLGEIGASEFVTENRLEVILPETNLGAILSAMRSSHPYEVVAHDVIPLKNTASEWGIGRVGELETPVDAANFLASVRAALNFDALRFVGPTDRRIRRVAVCGGAGAELVPDAIAAGADCFVTSDIRHHEFVDAAARGFLLIDAGHEATEMPGAAAMAGALSPHLPKVEFVALRNDGSLYER